MTPDKPAPAVLFDPFEAPAPATIPAAAKQPALAKPRLANVSDNPVNDLAQVVASLPPEDVDVIRDMALTVIDGATPDNWIEKLESGTSKAGIKQLLDSRGREIIFLARLSGGMKNRDALRFAGIQFYGQVTALNCRSKTYRALLHEAQRRQLTEMAAPVVDSLVDAAIDGDIVETYNEYGTLKKRAKKHNTRAAELLLRAGDRRFQQSDGPAAGATPGVVYQIGQVNVLAGPGQMATPPAQLREFGANDSNIKSKVNAEIINSKDFSDD